MTPYRHPIHASPANPASHTTSFEGGVQRTLWLLPASIALKLPPPRSQIPFGRRRKGDNVLGGRRSRGGKRLERGRVVGFARDHCRTGSRITVANRIRMKTRRIKERRRRQSSRQNNRLGPATEEKDGKTRTTDRMLIEREREGGRKKKGRSEVEKERGRSSKTFTACALQPGKGPKGNGRRRLERNPKGQEPDELFNCWTGLAS